jgi:hypothetical protein
MPNFHLERERLRPPFPYKEMGSVLNIGTSCLEVTLNLMQRCGRRESCVFWFGDRTKTGGLARAVIAPQQRMSWGNFHVSRAAMVEMADRVDGRGWRPLAQVHCHPGSNVEHSWYDDEMIASKRALSIVIPHYGVGGRNGLDDAGIHEWQDGFWHMLAPDVAARRVAVVDHLALDLTEDLR